MPVPLANVILILVGAYVVVGLLFALPFVLRGVNRIDPVARESTWGFRLIIIPGVIGLWPVLARRWIAGRPVEENNAHRAAARRGPAP